MTKFTISLGICLRFLAIGSSIFLLASLYGSGFEAIGFFLIFLVLACIFMIPVFLITTFVAGYIFSLPYSYRSCFVFFSFVFVLPVELAFVIAICNDQDSPGKMVLMTISAFQALSLASCYLCRKDLTVFYNERHEAQQFVNENSPRFDYYQSGLN
ncbi:MAG TPA: hypothetical protein VK625_04560 [Flavitalea sp.]|nr:hypothetical protein [Flavitalea sp.]